MRKVWRLAVVVAAALVCGVGAWGQNGGAASAPADAGPLVISAVAEPATVHPGDTMKFNVEIKNVSQEEQRIDVPNIVRAVQTDVPGIVIPGWPARGGIGPVVTFQSVGIAAGESYKRTFNANVSPTQALGDVMVRVGVPLKRGGDKTWSAAVKVTVVAKEAVANPLYNLWKGQEGKSATFQRSETISGGAPVAGGFGQTSLNTVTYGCEKFTDEQAVIAVKLGEAPAQALNIAAKMMADDPGYPKPAGKEELKIGEKTYACTRYTYFTGSPAEMGRDGQGLRGRVTVWVAEGVPGGVVQRKILLTIRASYDITETLVEK